MHKQCKEAVQSAKQKQTEKGSLALARRSEQIPGLGRWQARRGEAMSWGAREGAMEHVRQNTNKKTVGKSLARDDDDGVFNLVARTSDSEPASASAGYGPKEILH